MADLSRNEKIASTMLREEGRGGGGGHANKSMQSEVLRYNIMMLHAANRK